jgi:hypothetical protein
MRRKRFILPGKGSLTHNITLKIGAWVIIVVFLTAILSYLQVAAKIEEQALRQLNTYVSDRTLQENKIFKQTEDNLLHLKELILADLEKEQFTPPSMFREDITHAFDKLVERDADGVQRNLVLTQQNTCIYINPPNSFDFQTEQRFLRWHKLLSDYGKTWDSLFKNVYILFASANSLNTRLLIFNSPNKNIFKSLILKIILNENLFGRRCITTNHQPNGWFLQLCPLIGRANTWFLLGMILNLMNY